MGNRRLGCWRRFSATGALVGLALSGIATESRAITPGNPGPGDVQFSIDSGQNVQAISPYIYGSNSPAITNRTSDRLGGNRWSAYNWETNASNAGKDYKYENDNYLVNGLPNPNNPGAAISPTMLAAAANNRALIATVPMAGYVSGDMSGPVALSDFAPSARFKVVVPKKETVYGGTAQAALSLTPNTSDNYVFGDEYVNWVENTKAVGQNVFYDLDNEPGLWGESLPPGFNVDNWSAYDQPGRTHPEVHPYAPTYSEMRDKTIAHASAIKDVNPNAIVFGGVGYGWNEFTSLQNAPDAAMHELPSHPGGDEPGEMHYYEWLLSEVGAEEANQGRTLMDVLDLHWYPEAQGGGVRISDENSTNPSQAVIDARVEAPRSLWDPTYTETSWITQWSTQGPIKLLPRVQRDIDDFKPGTKIAVSEYNYGGGDHISGGIAEADFLGILGREGVFAANWWELGGGASYVDAAFDMYLNYDGAGGTFGDTSVDAETDDIAASAVYASLDSTDPNRMVVVAINRTGTAQDASIQLTHDRIFDHAEIYRLTSASPNPVQGADMELDLVNALLYTLPAYSVTTLVFGADGLPGDYNHDGTVDAADYTVWRDSVGLSGDQAADGNEDNMVDEDDFLLWRMNFGRTESMGGGAAATAVPEPASLTLLCWCGLALIAWRRSRG